MKIGRLLFFGCFIVVSIGLAGCGSTSGGSVSSVETVPSEDANVTGVKYEIFPGDRVKLQVYQEPTLTTTVTVQNDGTAMFPLIGPIKVAGKTVTEASRAIEKAYADGYLIDPLVTLTVAEHAKRQYTIFGQVKQPGEHELPVGEKITLLEAIGRAGGYTSIASPSNVTLKRDVGGETKVYRLNARKMARNQQTEQFYVQPGDVITVHESAF